MNYRIETAKNYKQFDTRWAELAYRVLPSCMRLNGCGATALADIISPVKSINPKSTRKWLLEHGYVSAHDGTYWAGISACMKAYGLENVKNVPTMSGFFSELSKGRRVGIILFGKGTKGGRTYTTSGHLCAVTGYKYKNGKHYMYLNDPGPRGNNGFICYETEARGLCLQVWTGKIPEKKKPKKSTSSKPKKDTSSKPKTYKGFDVSYVQNGLTKKDFEAAKKAGWDFVIIRLGTVLKGCLYKDQEFESKFKNAKAAGIYTGVYFYSMAKTAADAKKEAQYVVKQLNGRELKYPVFIDYEDPSIKPASKAAGKKICEAFCKVIEAAGYEAGVYASYNWLKNYIEPIDKKYYVWLAQYPKATYNGRYEMHQYSSSGKVTGIGKTIDVNVSTIKPKKMPETKKEEKPKKTSTQKIADMAAKLAYKDKPEEAKYPTGKPTDEYKKALNKYYPDRKSWGKASRMGAACDVFAGTVVRAAGVDKDFPRGLSGQKPYLKISPHFDEVKKPTIKNLKDGDIIIYEKKSGGGHICIYVDGKIKEASHEKWYGVTTDTVKSRMDTTNKKWLRVYRAK